MSSETASLSFTDAEGPARLTLLSDATVQLHVSPLARADLEQMATDANTTALKWGASALVLLSGLGAALYLKRSKKAGLSVLGAAGLAGVGAWGIRRYIDDTFDWLSAPVPVAQVTASQTPDDANATLTFRFDGGGLRKAVVTLAPGEFDASEAAVFLSALARMKGEIGE